MMVEYFPSKEYHEEYLLDRNLRDDLHKGRSKEGINPKST